MVVNYELTAADFREAAAHHRRSAIRQRLLRRVRRATIGKLVMFTAIMAGYLIVRTVVPQMESFERVRSPLARTADVILPLIAVAAIFAPVRALLADGLRAPNWRAIATFTTTLLTFGVAAVLLYWATALSGRRMPGITALPASAVLAPHMVWLVVVVAAAALTARAQRLNVRLAWEGQQHLHLPFTLDASVEGLTLSTPNGRHEYPWRGVTAFVETPNLFLWHIADLTFQIVPKRAFASDEERDAFRNMLRNLIPSAKPAFEVLPAAGQASS
jgi:hypothetical protein